jgi:diguanylate cyclase (GGDEF)-like protein
MTDLAYNDGLTGLANRLQFRTRLAESLARHDRYEVGFTLLYLDLDKFKEVNDTLGHGAGDLLLQEIARRLEACVRAGDTVARFGGDEFVVLLENTGLPEQTTAIAEKIRGALDRPFDLSGHEINIRVSIGVAHCPLHGDHEQQLLSHADEAMYLEKKARS